MWQRIQTLFLVLSCVAIGALFFCNVVTINSPEGLDHVRYVQKPYLWLMIIIALVTLGALVTFKSRLLQMRLCALACLLSLGFGIWLLVEYLTVPDGIVFSWTAVLPFVAAILDALAWRGVLKDQLLIESAYRIRNSRSARR